jgi:hypothetical protein
VISMPRRVLVLAAAYSLALVLALAGNPSGPAASQVAHPSTGGPARQADTMFVTSHECLACHNGLTAPSGEDVSIGVSWRASMMANSSRDPYWQAAVRREVMDHPAAAAEIEHECSTCHMPMAHSAAVAAGQHARIFAHLPVGAGGSDDDRLAADGVSCTLCHQIGPERLGSRESFVGGFVIAPRNATGERRMFGPFAIDRGRSTIMRSATGMTPAESSHLRQSEVCATCHTLYTQALGPNGEVIGELPEQVPYLEWRHSAFREERSCQSCHMPEVAGPVRIASVLGDERPHLSRHTFVGGNFFMLRMLNRYRSELGVEALPQELEAAALATIGQLQRETATLSVASVDARAGELAFDVTVGNLTGHKLPTAYPSRRVWLHVTVHDPNGDRVFSSGAIEPSGLIRGNDNDADPGRFEPHYSEIRHQDEVQIYESVMQDASGAVTTGLLQATGYAKDNRLLPRGFDKSRRRPTSRSSVRPTKIQPSPPAAIASATSSIRARASGRSGWTSRFAISRLGIDGRRTFGRTAARRRDASSRGSRRCPPGQRSSWLRPARRCRRDREGGSR